MKEGKSQKRKKEKNRKRIIANKLQLLQNYKNIKKI